MSNEKNMDKQPVVSPRNFLKDTIQLKVETEAAFLELASRLYKIHTEEIWKGEYDSYEEFLMEARISKATASKLETVYSTFVLKYKFSAKRLAAIGWSSLYAVAPHADTKERAEELVERATLLKRDHLEQSIKTDARKGKECEHEWIRYDWCPKCSVRHKVLTD